MSDSRAYGGSLRLRSGGAYMRCGRESGMGKWMVGIAFLGLLGCSSRGVPVSPGYAVNEAYRKVAGVVLVQQRAKVLRGE